MASMTTGAANVPAHSPTLPPPPDAEDLGVSIAGARAELERSIQVAGLKNDPVAPLLRSVLSSLDLQHRLHVASTRHLRDVSDRLDAQVNASLALAENELAAKEADVVAKLAPQLARATDHSIRAQVWTIRTRTIALSAAGGVVLALVAAAGGYTMGFTTGRATEQQVSGALIGAADRNGPDGAALWGQVVANNDIRTAMASCEKTIVQQGARRACSLPIWIDPAPPPVAAGK